MLFAVVLGCGACMSRFLTVASGEPCPGGGQHAHIEVTGIVELWTASHHDPGLKVLGPAPTRRK